MNSISELMQHNHRECDELFAKAEESAANQDWNETLTAWESFTKELESHITEKEENVLFPALEEINGPMGPTQVMRNEHKQMRILVSQIKQSIADQNSTQFLGLSETLMMLMQQHNMKEEQILYPMIENCIPNAHKLLT
mgnify:CR=1 FL=1